MFKNNSIKKTIWIISHYTMPPQYETRIKTIKYAEYLQKQGYNVLLFTASTLHNTNINLLDGTSLYEKRIYGNLTYIHIYCHDYEGNGIKRIFNMKEFAHKFKKISSNFTQPSIIVAADMNCVNYYPIYKYCKSKGIPMIIDIRDLWPESIVEYLHFSKRNPIIQYLYAIEKRMYKNVDCAIISVEGGRDYIKEKHWEDDIPLNKIQYINNGVDLNDYYTHADTYKINDSELQDDIFKVIYTGSIRTMNNIESIIDAAEILKNENIKFLIYGDGPQRQQLEEEVKRKKLKVYFKGQVEKKYIPYILSKANVTLLNYAPSNMFRFGGSQNKFFEYAAAGKPIISNIKMGYDPILKYKLGKVVEAGNAKQLCNAIMMFVNDKELSKEYAHNCREFIKEFDYDILSEKLNIIIEKLLKGEEL